MTCSRSGEGVPLIGGMTLVIVVRTGMFDESFFFSSRRRHTRSYGDWSSDVCSSDLVSRLLLLLQSYHIGLEVGRYVSLERVIEENKDRYYETLEQSSQRWHEGTHDPWPFINYILFVLKRSEERRVGKECGSR